MKMVDKRYTITICLLLFYVFFSFVFTETVYASPLMVFATFSLVFILFFYDLILTRGKSVVVYQGQIIWWPFIFWMMLGYIIKGEFQFFVHFFACFCLLYTAVSNKTCINFPYKFMFIIGIITCAGIYSQLLFPAFYDSHIKTLFSEFRNEKISLWSDTNIGLSGFMPQLDRAAMPLIYIEGIVLYLADKIDFKRNLVLKVKPILLIILIAAVIMTGKKMATLAALAAPIIVMFFLTKKLQKKIKIIIIVLLAVVLVSYLFLRNIDSIAHSSGLSRYVTAYEMYSAGEDFSAGRDDIKQQCLRIFYENPVFGSGVSSLRDDYNIECHSGYLQVLCEQGAVGFIFMITPIICCLLFSIKCCRRTGPPFNNYIKYSIFCQIVYVLCSYSEHGMADTFLYVYYFLSIAIMYSAYYMNKHVKTVL